ncbi:MAG: sodium:proton antiporter [Gardnerella vaginalis]|nr:sodium:proton antiporter [Gardnerella vaginalis]MDK8328503.1 sodium:proton antiporter [Gardnerella vaginalis]
MPVFELILYIMAVVVLSSFLERFIPRVSVPLVQIAMGIIAAELPFFPNATLDPNMFMIVIVAPLIYFESREINKLALLSSFKYSATLAIGLVLATMIVVGILLPAIWPFVPITAALVLGAALGPTDAVAVSALSHEVSLTRKQFSVLQGESLFNDASGIVGFQFAVLVASSGVFDIVPALSSFTTKFFGGIAVGALVGFAANWLFEKIRSLGWETTKTRILMELFLPFLLYMGAENLKTSGMLALVTAGLLTKFDRSGVGPNVSRTNIVANSVWSVLSFGLNGAVFVLLGVALPKVVSSSWNDRGTNNLILVAIICVTLAVIIGVRFLWMLIMIRLARRTKVNQSEWLKSAIIMTLGGAKGTLTLALMFTLPMSFTLRNELIFIAGVVIVVTLLLANFILPLISPKNNNHELEAVTPIIIEVLRRTVEELTLNITQDNLKSDYYETRGAVLSVIDSYTERINRLKQNASKSDSKDYLLLRVDALNWEKDYIKQKLRDIKQEDATKFKMLDEEACERLLDQIMNSLRHIHAGSQKQSIMWHVRGRFRAAQRKYVTVARRVGNMIRRTAPLLREDMIFVRVRQIHIDVIHSVVKRLYQEMHKETYSTEHCSALLREYRTSEAFLRSRPNVAMSVKMIERIDDVKRQGYAIELRVIHDMYEAGDITRAQERQLRNNVYVMSVDANSDV